MKKYQGVAFFNLNRYGGGYRLTCDHKHHSQKAAKTCAERLRSIQLRKIATLARKNSSSRSWTVKI